LELEGGALCLDDWTVLRGETDLTSLIMQLRQKWAALFVRRIRAPSKPMTQVSLD
jgi:hypothetical protein